MAARGRPDGSLVDPAFDGPRRFPEGTLERRPVTEIEAEDSASFQRQLAGLEQAFERALASMALHFQPIVRAEDHAVIGYEALLRPNDPELPDPTTMFDAAERLNRLGKLNRSIRALVAEQLAAAEPARGLFFVNLHPRDLVDQALSSPYSPLARLRARIVLELTERDPLEAVADLRFRVAELREMGYRIAIDDLGAGHLRMQQLSPLDTDYVKLDMAVVREIDVHPVKRRLAASVIELCREQGVQVIAEGVESASERSALIELGCELLQGFYIARPHPSLVDPRSPT